MKDTISAIFNFALLTQLSREYDLSAAVQDEILAKYLEDRSNHVKKYFPSKEQRKTLSQEVEYLRSLKPVESRGFERVSRSGLFKSNSEKEWKQSADDAVRKGEVVVREGFLDFIKEIEKSGSIWGVVSVNFWTKFIRGVLVTVGMDDTVEILANYPDPDGILLGPTTGEGKRGPAATTSDAKLASMNNLLSSWTG